MSVAPPQTPFFLCSLLLTPWGGGAISLCLWSYYLAPACFLSEDKGQALCLNLP